MRLQLDNLVYDTTNPTKIDRLLSFGAVEVDKNNNVIEAGDTKEATKEFSKMKKEELVAELEKRGIEHDPKAKNDELVALLEKNE